MSATMMYRYSGRWSSPNSVVNVYLFRPCAPGSGKPVITLKSCVYINGKSFKRLGILFEDSLTDRFEIVKKIETEQIYDFACVMKNAGSVFDCEKILAKPRFRCGGAYHGILIDYLPSSLEYKIAVRHGVLGAPADFFINFDEVCPSVLGDSVVCVSFDVRVSKEINVRNLNVQVFPANTHLLASLLSTNPSTQPSVDGTPRASRQSSVEDLFSTLRVSSHPPATSDFGEFQKQEEYTQLDQLSEEDFYKLSPVLSQQQRFEDRFRITVTV